MVTQEEFKRRYDQHSFNTVFNADQYPVNRDLVLELRDVWLRIPALTMKTRSLKSLLKNPFRPRMLARLLHDTPVLIGFHNSQHGVIQAD